MFDPIAWLLADGPRPPLPPPPEQSSIRSTHTAQRVLVVDDERLIADTVAAILNNQGFEAIAAYNGEEALEAARGFQPDTVLTDVLMPKMSGVELGMKLRSELPETRVLLFSGQAATSELMRRAQAEGYYFELFPKPIHPEELIAKLKNPS